MVPGKFALQQSMYSLHYKVHTGGAPPALWLSCFNLPHLTSLNTPYIYIYIDINPTVSLVIHQLKYQELPINSILYWLNPNIPSKYHTNACLNPDVPWNIIVEIPQNQQFSQSIVGVHVGVDCETLTTGPVDGRPSWVPLRWEPPISMAYQMINMFRKKLIYYVLLYGFI